MRCPDCNKFVGMDLGEPEVDLDYDGGKVSGTVRIVRTCSECSQDLKEATFDVDEEIDLLSALGEECLKEEEGHELTFEITDEEATEDVQATDRKGKPITNPRYRKSLYGFSVDWTVKCECGKTSTGTIADHIAASEMEELA